MPLRLLHLFAAVLCLFAVACSDEVSSEEEARQAYLGLDPLVVPAIDLGFQGMATAQGANIDPQTANGAKAGTLVVTGKVDQGSSDNKNMTLSLELTGWSADGKITYDTPADVAQQPVLTLALKKLPNADLTGTLVGDFSMTGELKGKVALNLALVGKTEADASGKIVRKAGTTRITGTATAAGDTYTVDVTR